MQYSIEPRTKKYVKIYGFLSFARNIPNKYQKQSLNTAIDFLKNASEKVVYSAGEFMGNEIAGAVAKLCDNEVVKPDQLSRNVEEIIIPSDKRGQILNTLRQAL